MSADCERLLLARARDLADLSDLREEVLACLGAARHAGLDPEALAGLTGAALALGATSTTAWSAGSGWTGTHPDERQFLAHLAAIGDDLDEHAAAAGRLGWQATAALETARSDLAAATGQLADARRALAAAYGMPVGDPCDGCHAAKAAAITAAQTAVHEAAGAVRDGQTRTAICEDITNALPGLQRRLAHARTRLQAVPADLGDTYQAVYQLIRRGGVLPYQGRWVTGTTPPAG